MSSRRKAPRYSGVQMVCPYFSREEAISISCQAKCSGMRCRLTFADKNKKQEWAKRFCETFQYWQCPLCEMQDGEEED
ncbi:MAG: hypothetical protein IKS31_01415 [Clostridia bacterium]|nr:hypothetical protein [Clostridia bacterium]